MPRERGAIHLTQENYRVNSIWHDRERERGAQCRSECSLILFSIHCAQRLEALEGSPARSLDALYHTLRGQRDRTSGPWLHCPCWVAQEGVVSTARRQTQLTHQDN
ncbi:hypothetical protein ILYODFUR_032352 [Ilyodon furcidens]|uniref:Uncharacterized protein n=1 Tax=Ilyodon furcidens TaxID=33524 RepID=A0ABV0T213_9TELE